MKDLTREEMLNINGGFWGVVGEFFDRATTLEAPERAPYYEKPDFSKKETSINMKIMIVIKVQIGIVVLEMIGKFMKEGVTVNCGSIVRV